MSMLPAVILCFVPLIMYVFLDFHIAQACKPVVKLAGFWGSIRTLARGYEIVMGLLLFTPVAFLAWFPFVSEFQTRMLFNQAFSRGYDVDHLLELINVAANVLSNMIEG
ncbi:callose synthase 3 [Tanacetum coccineum]